MSVIVMLFLLFLILDRSLYTASLFTEMKIPLLRRSAIKDIYPLIVLSPT